LPPLFIGQLVVGGQEGGFFGLACGGIGEDEGEGSQDVGEVAAAEAVEVGDEDFNLLAG
jgi:hypothetical protein